MFWCVQGAMNIFVVHLRIPHLMSLVAVLVVVAKVPLLFQLLPNTLFLIGVNPKIC